MVSWSMQLCIRTEVSGCTLVNKKAESDVKTEGGSSSLTCDR